MTDDGVGASNILCLNDHGNSGQVMEQDPTGQYECPECGRVATIAYKYYGPSGGGSA